MLGADWPSAARLAAEYAHVLVRSAMRDREGVVEDLVDLLEMDEVEPWRTGGHEVAVVELVDALIEDQIRAERSWSEPTDVDRLLAVFAALEEEGIACFEDHGADVNDGHALARAEIIHSGRAALARGYVFYTGQDLETAVEEGLLFLGYWGWGFRPPEEVRGALVAVLREHGFDVEEPSVEERVRVDVAWNRRGWLAGRLPSLG